MGSEYQLGSLRAWWIWIIAVTFVAFLFSFQTAFAIVNPKVQEELNLSVAQIATIAAFYMWAFAIFQFFSGAVLDRLGARKVLPVSISFVTLGIFLFANAKSFEILLLSQIVIAIGSSAGFVGTGYVSAQWFGMTKFSFMFGLAQMIVAMISAFSQNLIGFALDMVTWRKLFNLTAVFGVILITLGFLYIRDPKPVVNDHQGGIFKFIASIFKGILAVLKIGHIWIASIVGALSFGSMLALGVVWMPKLMMAHGFSHATSHLGTSLLWLGLAAGCAVIPFCSDKIQKRKILIVFCNAVQVAAIVALLYISALNASGAMTLCFIFGFFNAAQMLAFSTAADVVHPSQIGTCAAIVNGIMFIAGGILMHHPGVRFGKGIEAGFDPKSVELAQYAALPITIAVILALVISVLMKETYPSKVMR